MKVVKTISYFSDGQLSLATYTRGIYLRNMREAKIFKEGGRMTYQWTDDSQRLTV